MRIAISTGGGDAPGLNAVIRAIVLSAHMRGWQTYGIRRGYGGLLGDDSPLRRYVASPTWAARFWEPPTGAILFGGL
jgi:6-phosphofructokinase